MPVLFTKKYDNECHLLVWQITESAIELQAMLSSDILTDAELAETRHPQKQLEFYASRLAIQTLAAKLGIAFFGTKKDEYGKPFMVGNEWQMSLTHSNRYIAVAMHAQKSLGIDIEKPSEKMKKILPRLFSTSEIDEIADDLNKLSVYWSAKEALYKLYGKRKVDFRKDLLVFEANYKIIGKISMPDWQFDHEIWVEKIEEYFLTIAL